MKFALALTALAGAATAMPNMEAVYDEERQAYVDELNARPNMTWTAAIEPRFKGKKMGEHIRSLTGVVNHLESLREGIEAGDIEEVFDVADNIPESFDSAENFAECASMISEIRDQSACGCCWAFGAAEAASDRMCIASGGKLLMPLSDEDVCFCGSYNGCGGGQLSTAWYHIKNWGAVTGGLYQDSGNFKGFCKDFSLPHCHHHGPQGNDPYPAEGTAGCPNARSPKCPRSCDSTAVAPNNVFSSNKYTFSGRIQTFSGEAQIQTALMTGGPVEAAFSVYSDFENYSGGVYQQTSQNFLGGHAIKIVGWGVDNGVKYWKVANSWNPYWAEDGYFRILRGVDECGIESGTMGSSPDSTWHLM